ncbi:MAG: RNA-binding cell elongation regulator Jag/EloR [Chloroflexota bacterium]
MTEQRTSLEVIAATVEEAIAQGATQLGLPAESLQVEVLDEGGKGLFGLGTRQARVRLTVRPSAAAPQAKAEPAMVEGDEAVTVAREIVVELLERMSIRARVHARWGEEVDENDIRPLLVDIRGDDLSILIGRRGETLSALQYITRMIVGKELGHPVAVVIDVEGYRARRERQLRQLARRMASQAVDFGRTMALEPMPANERRIIHLELRDRQDVYTESVGEGEHRKVTIIPRE